MVILLESGKLFFSGKPKLKVKLVYADVLSVDAKSVLQANGILFSYRTMTEHVFNCEDRDICLLEQAVEGIEDPAEALAVIRQYLEHKSEFLGENKDI